MIESLFTLLMTYPALSICLGFALAVLIIIIFRKVIEKYLIKKYDLYNIPQVEEALKESLPMKKVSNQGMYSVESIENVENEIFINKVTNNLNKIKNKK